jgi:GntR family transcriptional regulator/MocR family aminotransferase
MPSLPLQLDRQANKPLYRQIEDHIRQLILDGRLQPGSRLPSVRQLAADQGIARITVVAAYEQLTAEGYIEARPGVGTVIAPELPEQWMRVRAASLLNRRRNPPANRSQFPAASPFAFPRAFFDGAPFYVHPERARFDLATGATSLDLFPAAIWERAIREAWRELSTDAGSPLTHYREPAGDWELRKELASYLGASRAVACDPGDVVITAGAQGAMAAAARLWLDPTRTFAVEDPGSPHLWRTFQVSGAHMVGIPVDGSGMQVSLLPKDVDLVLVTPSWQYPAGGTLLLKRRLQLLDWARNSAALVIEDDCDSELRYSGHPIPSLQGLDDDGRVLYVGTFSKVLFPGLRTGYAIVSKSLGPQLRAMIEAMDRGPSAIEQRALAIFIREGHFERHLRRLRLAFAERQEAMVREVRTHLAGILAVEPTPAGTHLVARIVNDRWTATQLAATAREGGVIVEPVSFSRVSEAPDNELIIHYARHRPDEIEAAVKSLKAAWSTGRGRPIEPPATA